MAAPRSKKTRPTSCTHATCALDPAALIAAFNFLMRSTLTAAERKKLRVIAELSAILDDPTDA